MSKFYKSLFTLLFKLHSDIKYVLLTQTCHMSITRIRYGIWRFFKWYGHTPCEILNPCQYGFREQMSTTLALVKVVSENTKKHSIGIFIDLRKALDTVGHQPLCKKLKLCGIRGVAYQWIRSYLSNRTQYVMKDINLSFYLYCVVFLKVLS